MKISVIIPCYNEEKYIENCLKSIINQSKKPNEVIVVNNNSKDNTVKIVKNYQKNYQYIKIIKEKNQGIAYARNKGFNSARGNILVKCDADTILPNNWIKKTLKVFSKNKNIIGYSNHFYFYSSFILRKFKIFSYFYQNFFKKLFGYGVLIGPAFAIRRDVWSKVKNQVCLNDDEVHEDIDLSIHISKFGKIFIDDKLFINISTRRIKYNPFSFFIEYPLIFLKMLKSHRHLI